MKRVVMFSGGVGSWMAAKRVAERHGTEHMVLLFTDTLIEDEDLYRFLPEAAANVGAPLVRVADGRTPWEVFHDVRLLGNSRIAPCSRVLKQEQARQWVIENTVLPTIVLGIDWSEVHRLDGARRGWVPFAVEAPMTEKPFMTKAMMLDALRAEGIQPSRLYEAGFPHNNCGGFCVRAGKEHFARLLREMPERYRYHEEQEQGIRDYLGKPVTILSDWHGEGGHERTPLTLRELRERIESGCQIPMDGSGGCGCFLEAV